MRKAFFMVLAGILTGALLLAAAPSYAGSAKYTKHFDESLFMVSEEGLYSLELILDNRKYGIGDGVIGIALHNDGDHDVKGAKLTIEYENRETYEISEGTYNIVDIQNGLYRVTGLDLKREGQWELRVQVEKGDSKDMAVFLFPEMWERKLGKGKYTKDEVGE